MSAATSLLLFFLGVSLAAGAAATGLIGPRKPLAVIAPTLAAVVALYLVGHRLGLSAGPSVRLFGFQVSLLFDVAVAVGAALLAAAVQRELAVRRRARLGEADLPRT